MASVLQQLPGRRQAGGSSTVTNRLHASGARRRAPCCAGPQPPVSKGFSLLEWTNKVLPQGQLVSGVKAGWRLAWQTMVRELAPQTKEGQYSRPSYAFGARIGSPEFPAASGRYHLYLGNACPWCHRVSLALVLRGLARPATAPGAGSAAAAGQQQQRGAGQHVTMTVMVDDPTRARRGGWVFGAADPDPMFGAADLWEVYDRCQPGFRGRCTAPLLVDRASRAAVCNESSEIVRSLDALHLPGCTDVELRPQRLVADIDALNARIYSAINNGVYRSGFATTQAAYDAVQQELWAAMDEMEARLHSSRFLLGDRLTESDVWLLPTVLRLDAMYGPIFKCGRRRVFGSGPGREGDYPALAAWVRDLWQLEVPGSRLQIRDTLDLDAARRSYFGSLFPLNPGGIVPAGPSQADLELERPAGRGSARLEDACHVRSSGAQVAGKGVAVL